MIIKIDEDEMENGKDVSKRLMAERDGGLPWSVIFDGDGNELITSVGPDGNVGCPARPNEIKHFVAMIEQTCSPKTKEKISELETALEAYAKVLLGN